MLKMNEWFLPRRTSNGATCVETLCTEDTVRVRNNLRRDAGTAVFTHEEWVVFIKSVKDGDYDL
jgi:Domain of unknown function (DUF397)